MLHYDPNTTLSTTHGYAFRYNVFNKQELKQIVKYCNSLPKVIATVNKPELCENHRVSDIAWVKFNNDCKWFYDKLAFNIDSLNQNFYQFDLTGFTDYQFTEYKASKQGKYDWHLDTHLGENPQFLTRKLSATLLLNDNFDGGDFQFHDLIEQPKMSAGTLIVFPSFLVHRVAPITKGVRNSLVCWCVGPKFK
jgi:PKHD-type hydroxylase